jgi:hypothetical protein
MRETPPELMITPPVTQSSIMSPAFLFRRTGGRASKS